MNSHLPAVIFASVLLTCSHTHETIEPGVLEVRLGDQPETAELLSAIEKLLEAHETCLFPSEVRALVPAGLDGKGSWLDVEEQCLGALRITSIDPQSKGLVAVEVVRRGRTVRRENIYVVFASYVESDWTLTWPVGTGPPIR